MANDNTNRGPAVVPLIAASLLMFALGLTHRALPARLLTPLSTTPIDPAALERFPLQIGDWIGEDVPLDETIPRKIDAEACLNRRYTRRLGSESVSLFMAASGTTVGHLVGHPPEVCNVLSGSTLVDRHTVKLSLNNGMELPCLVLHFSHAGLLDSVKNTVLYYYVADGQYYDDRSLLQLRIRRGPSMVHCVAQVQIVASSTETRPVDSMTGIVSEFAVDSASAIVEMFQRIEENQRSGQSRKTSEGI